MKITKQLSTAINRGRTAIMLLSAVAFLAIGSAANAVVLLGNPFTPIGANYSIFALQGIDAANPQGTSGFSPQVNKDFEFPDAIGVSYDRGGGQLTDFGLGLYFNAQNQVQSTGMRFQFNTLVTASSLTVRLEDFDIKAGDTFFNPNKVEPGILLLGDNNTIYGSATPTDIFSALVNVPASGGKGGKKGKASDVWDVNFAQLLANLHLADAPIRGFILYADAANGERPNSDPYLLVSAGNGIVVPEPATYLAGFAAFAFALLFHARQVRKKKNTL